MTGLSSRIDEAIQYIRKKTRAAPDIGMILGTGLGSLADEMDIEISIEYGDIPHFAKSTVESHRGRLLFGRLAGKSVVAMQGRFHYYEGYTLQQVTFPVRVMKRLGVKVLIITNISGAVNPRFGIGDLVMITDHINMQGVNPLMGPNDDELGPRFPNMRNVYDKKLRALAEKTALDCDVPLHEGVYVAVTGPSLETGAEYRMVGIIGGDVVGMSTAPEAIVARHQATRVLGFSLVTDLGIPGASETRPGENALDAAARAEPKLRKLIRAIIERMTV